MSKTSKWDDRAEQILASAAMAGGTAAEVVEALALAGYTFTPRQVAIRRGLLARGLAEREGVELPAFRVVPPVKREPDFAALARVLRESRGGA